MVFGSGFSNHGFIVIEDSKLHGFGWNKWFQLGLGDNKKRKVLSEIKFFSSKIIIKISCGKRYTIFLTKNNEIYSVGRNKNGELGVNDNLDRKIPTRVSIKDQNEVIKVIDVFVGCSHSFVLSNLLEVYSFGANKKGQLGVGDTIDRVTATKALLPEKIISVCGGGHAHSFFISILGSVFVCGYNGFDQLGIGGNSNIITTPKKILFFKKKKILQVCCGMAHTFFVTEDNQLYGTGVNSRGQLGLGNNVNQTIPCVVATLKDEKVILVKCGEDHSLFKCMKKTMITGSNFHGQIGNGNYEKVISPVLLKGKEIFIQSLMLSSSSIYFTKNEVYGCGKNNYDELFCGNEKKWNRKKYPNLFKIRNLKVKKRNLKLKKEEIERFEFLKLSGKDDEKLLF